MYLNKKILICNKNFDKKKIKDLIEWFITNHGTLRTNKLLNKLKTIGFNYSTKAGISIGPDDLLVPTLKEKLIKNTQDKINKRKKNLTNLRTNSTQKEIETWNITNEIVKNDIIKNYRQTDLLNPIYIMIQSGARGNISQIKQIVGLRGLMSDSKGEIINTPIKNNFKDGLTIKEYFISCYGARKGIIDTALKTANSGYLTRKLVYVAQNITIKQQNCNTNTGIVIKIISKNKKQYTLNKNKILGRILAENIINKQTNKLIFSKGQDICNYIAKNLLKNNKEIFLRSPLKCNLNIGICQICYGWNLGTNKLVRIKEAVGILAAQSIGEPGTQLTMRTFHTGGIFTSEIASIINAPHKGKILFNFNKETRKIKTKHQQVMLFLEKNKNIYIKKNRFKISKILLPKYSTIYLENNKKVFNKQIIAEIPKWKKSKIEKRTKINYKEIKNVNSGEIKIQINKTKIIWVLNGQIIGNENLLKKIYQKKTDLSNELTKKITKKNNETKRIIIKLNYKKIKKLKTITNIKKNKNKKVYEITNKYNFEKEILINRKHNKELARNKIKNNKKLGEGYYKPTGILIESRKKIAILKIGENYKTMKDSKINLKNCTLVKPNTILFKNLLEKEKNKDIVDGLPKIEQILEAKQFSTNNINQINETIHERTKKIFQQLSNRYENKIANKKTLHNIQRFLVKEVQKVYTSQGINISEKHIEVIIRQMTSKVIIKSNNGIKLIQGEIISINKIEKINNNTNKKLSYEPIIIGITKASLLNESFISAACFQETIRILTKSAVMGKIDWLIGIKENILLGNLVPIGTN
uniref:DNA-directed RNA polymerase n=1 Tax=Lepocinclis tripteris TaxID=135494 RepID=A0A3G3LL27_9EUGL|nr:RNA polymerase beta'' subunit [Lepocinclis tripteris]